MIEIKTILINRLKWPLKSFSYRSKSFQDLFADIKRNGLRVPIVLDSKNKIVDGYFRAMAMKILGKKRIKYLRREAK